MKSIKVAVVFMLSILLSACKFEIHPVTNESYTIANNSGEYYDIEYAKVKSSWNGTEHINFVISDLKFDSEEEIIWYTEDTDYDYPDINMLKPQKILYLYHTNDYRCYYLSYELGDSIIISGDQDFIEFYSHKIDINIEDTPEMDSVYREDYIKIANDLRKNYTKSELREEFEKCGYDYRNILFLYDLPMLESPF